MHRLLVQMLAHEIRIWDLLQRIPDLLKQCFALAHLSYNSIFKNANNCVFADNIGTYISLISFTNMVEIVKKFVKVLVDIKCALAFILCGQNNDMELFHLSIG